MTEALDAKTFDIAEMFAGITYPKDTVPVYTNPGVGYEIHKLSEAAKEAVALKDEDAAREVSEKRDKLISESEKYRYEFTIQGHSKAEREAIADKVKEQFPPETDWMGREKYTDEADRLFVNLTWALHIAQIVAPSGAVKTAPEAAEIELLRAQLPDSEQKRIEAAIQELSEGTKAGFETLAMEHDFLSSASHEA